MAASKRTMRTPDDFIQLLKFLTKIFDETDIMMDDFIANSKKYEKQLKAYDLDLTDLNWVAAMTEMFTPKQISLLLNILVQLTHYTAKFSLSEDRIKEMHEMLQMIKDIRANLHELLGDKN